MGDCLPVNGVLTLTGYGVRLSVDGGALTVEDGTGDERRSGRFHRSEVRNGPLRLQRVVVLAHSGSVSLEAVRWCLDQDIAVVALAPDGAPYIRAWSHSKDDARLRRAQARAGEGESVLGASIVRQLLQAKFEAEATTLTSLGVDVEGRNRAVMRTLTEQLVGARDISSLRVLEAQRASIFWQTLADLPLPWVSRDVGRIPASWAVVGPRNSALGGTGPRRAVTPFHAALNVLFACLEMEALIALRTVGLDPGLGILHLDAPNRASLALDILEPVRPALVLLLRELLGRRPLRLQDVVQRRDGEVRCRPSFLRELWETAPRWRLAVAPYAETVVERVGVEAGVRVTSPLTGRRRREASNELRGYAAWRPVPKALTLAKGCQTCGRPLSLAGSRSKCRGCLDQVARVRGERRATQRDPEIPVRAFARFLGLRSPDELTEYFSNWSASDLSAAAGASIFAANRWKTGRVVPQRRFWNNLLAHTNRGYGVSLSSN
jgi:CRISPR-associated protein Cas1